MTGSTEAFGALGAWGASASFDALPAPVRTSLERAVTNLLAVAAGGAALPELAALRRVWASSPGPATILGTHERVSVEAAVWLNGVSAVATERDEGNRYSKGHPAAQTVPAVLALAESLDVRGPRLWNALLVGYEVAARFGRATDFHPQAHTHGPLGAAGAAAGCAVLLGLDADGIARAIEAGAAMAPATSWRTVHAGAAVRDQWVGEGALAGLAGARYAAAGLPVGGGGLSASLGVLDPDRLIDGLGTDHLVSSSYLKQHSSCAYTHGPADAALLVRDRLLAAGASAAQIVEVAVDGVASAAALPATTWSTRHGAYFSVPFAVASALLHGDVALERAAVPPAPELAALAQRVTVRDATAELRPATATSRPARVTAVLRDGSRLSAAVAHPAGDALDSPFSEQRMDELLTEALAPIGRAAADAHRVVAGLGDDTPGAVSTALTHLTPTLEGALT